MADIFISYTSDDRATIELLAEVLTSEGFSVFWDAHLGAGQPYREVIAKELAECRCVVVAWSKQSALSRWVIDEAERGLELGRLVPISLDDSLPPLGFRQLQTAKLQGWRGNASDHRYKALVSAIRAFTSAEDQSADPLKANREVRRRLVELIDVPARHVFLLLTKILVIIFYGAFFYVGLLVSGLWLAVALIVALGVVDAVIPARMNPHLKDPFSRWSAETDLESIRGYLILAAASFCLLFWVQDRLHLPYVLTFWLTVLPVMYLTSIARSKKR